MRYETKPSLFSCINVPTQYVWGQDCVWRNAWWFQGFNPDKHDFKTWSFPKVGIRKQLVETTTENGKVLDHAKSCCSKIQSEFESDFCQPWLATKKQLPIPELHTCTYSSGRHSSRIRLCHFWTLTSISCFVPLLHCRLDLKAISACMIHADLSVNCQVHMFL